MAALALALAILAAYSKAAQAGTRSIADTTILAEREGEAHLQAAFSCAGRRRERTPQRREGSRIVRPLPPEACGTLSSSTKSRMRSHEVGPSENGRAAS